MITPFPPVSSRDRSADGPAGRAFVVGGTAVLGVSGDPACVLLEHAESTHAAPTTRPAIQRTARTCPDASAIRNPPVPGLDGAKPLRPRRSRSPTNQMTRTQTSAHGCDDLSVPIYAEHGTICQPHGPLTELQGVEKRT